jgi:hypothetical protein
VIFGRKHGWSDWWRCCSSRCCRRSFASGWILAWVLGILVVLAMLLSVTGFVVAGAAAS